MNRLKVVYEFVLVSMMIIVGAFTFVNALLNAEYWWIIGALFYTVIVNDIFCHRICSHKMFNVDVSSITYKIMVWLASVDLAYGPVIGITKTHHAHHLYSDDGPEDIMNWRYHWYATCLLLPVPMFKYTPPRNIAEYYKRQQRTYGHILNDPWTKFCSEHKLIISTVTLLIMVLVFPLILFNIFMMGRFLMSVATMLAAICGHIKNFPGSYRNYNTKDETSNNLLFYYMFLGIFSGLLQNNHHGAPRSMNPNPNWWEIDTSKPFVLLLKLLMEDKHVDSERSTC